MPSVNYCVGSTTWARIWPSGSRKSVRSRCSWRRGWWPWLATSSVGGGAETTREVASPNGIFKPAQPVLSPERVSVRSARLRWSRVDPRLFNPTESFAKPFAEPGTRGPTASRGGIGGVFERL